MKKSEKGGFGGFVLEDACRFLSFFFLLGGGGVISRGILSLFCFHSTYFVFLLASVSTCKVCNFSLS